MFQELFYNLCLLYNATNKVLNPFQDGGGYHIESMDLFLYDNGLRLERVKGLVR